MSDERDDTDSVTGENEPPDEWWEQQSAAGRVAGIRPATASVPVTEAMLEEAIRAVVRLECCSPRLARNIVPVILRAALGASPVLTDAEREALDRLETRTRKEGASQFYPEPERQKAVHELSALRKLRGTDG